MASGSSTSKSDDQKHYSEKEAAQKEQNGASSLSSSSSKQIKYIAIVVLVIIVVMSAAMGTIWGVVKPKRPVYAIEYGAIAHATIPLDRESLSGNLTFVMRSYNPNKKSTIYYKSMKIYNRYSENKATTSVKRVEDFSQPPFNVTRIPFIVPVQISTAPGEDVMEYLQHGRITVNISVKADMRFRYGNWKSNPRPIGIYCQAAAVMLGHNFQTTDCYVDL